jgi:hypothetical protein
VGLEYETRSLRGGGDHNVEGPEPEVHERAMACVEGGQRAMRREGASRKPRLPSNDHPRGPGGRFSGF